MTENKELKLREILGEFEKILMNTYKSDGCVTSAITEIYKNQATQQIKLWACERLEKKTEIGQVIADSEGTVYPTKEEFDFEAGWNAHYDQSKKNIMEER